MIRVMCAWVLLSLLCMAGAVPAFAGSDKQILGWIEYARVFPGNVEIKAKLDTGAKMSSLSCNCLTPFERNGESWIRFSIEGRDGEPVQFERRIVGHIRVKRHFGKVQRRPVVLLGICLAGVYEITRVNLVDRSGFRYPILIGRNELQGRFIVDPQQTFRSRPRCHGERRLE